MESEVLVAHRANRSLVLEESHEVGANVGRTVLVPVQWKHTVSLGATP